MATIEYEERGMGNQIPVRITITRPDDWHLHLRDGAAMVSVLPSTGHVISRALIMPNLRPPVTDVLKARTYYEEICAISKKLESEHRFEPLMTLYLTDNTTPKDVEEAAKSGIVKAFKLYPAGATTNSADGVTDIAKMEAVFEAMEEHGVVLCVHGEMLRDASGEFDIFDREAYFIGRILDPLVRKHPRFKIVLEHVTTKEGVDFVRGAGPNIAATITAHHLLLNRNALFQGGVRPHHYCLPVLKREEHRQALLKAVASGSHKFFLGTDSAPHARNTKESACGCAGCFTAYAAIELYAEAFDSVGALDQLEGFASFNGAKFYGLPRNRDEITLIRKSWTAPVAIPYIGDDPLVPFRAGELVHWQIEGLEYPS